MLFTFAILFICVLAGEDIPAATILASNTTAKATTTTKSTKKLTYWQRRALFRKLLFKIRFNRFKKAMRARGKKYSDKFLLVLYKWRLRRLRYLRYRRMMMRWRIRNYYRRMRMRMRIRAWLRKRKLAAAKKKATKTTTKNTKK